MKKVKILVTAILMFSLLLSFYSNDNKVEAISEQKTDVLPPLNELALVFVPADDFTRLIFGANINLPFQEVSPELQLKCDPPCDPKLCQKCACVSLHIWIPEDIPGEDPFNFDPECNGGAWMCVPSCDFGEQCCNGNCFDPNGPNGVPGPASDFDDLKCCGDKTCSVSEDCCAGGCIKPRTRQCCSDADPEYSCLQLAESCCDGVCCATAFDRICADINADGKRECVECTSDSNCPRSYNGRDATHCIDGRCQALCGYGEHDCNGECCLEPCCRGECCSNYCARCGDEGFCLYDYDPNTAQCCFPFAGFDGQSCPFNQPCCGSGCCQVGEKCCDLERCVPSDGCCNNAECPSIYAQYCVNGECVECTEDAFCQSWYEDEDMRCISGTCQKQKD